jgi:hypothetical protein
VDLSGTSARMTMDEGLYNFVEDNVSLRCDCLDGRRFYFDCFDIIQISLHRNALGRSNSTGPRKPHQQSEASSDLSILRSQQARRILPRNQFYCRRDAAILKVAVGCGGYRLTTTMSWLRVMST